LASVNAEAQKNGARRDAVLASDMFCNTSALAPADAPATHIERAAEDAGFGDRARPGQEELEDSGSGGEKPPVQLSLRLKTQQEAPVLRASRLQTKQKNARSTFDEAVLFEIVRIRKHIHGLGGRSNLQQKQNKSSDSPFRLKRGRIVVVPALRIPSTRNQH